MPLESDISRLLVAREGGEYEVKTPAGYIDVLTPKILYEVKTASGWKSALGQVLSYGKYYPDRKLKLYLYGEAKGKQKLLIKEQCATHNVGVEWHREPRLGEPAPAPKVDTIKLKLWSIDEYQNKAISTINIVTPTMPIAHEILDNYLDEAMAVFDDLLANDLTLTLHYTFGGEQVKLTRTRPTIFGKPSLYRLYISMMPGTGFPFSVSLPGIRSRLSNDHPIAPDANYAYSKSTPEMIALRELVLHPTFRWMSQRDEPAIHVVKIIRQYIKR